MTITTKGRATSTTTTGDEETFGLGPEPDRGASSPGGDLPEEEPRASSRAEPDSPWVTIGGEDADHRRFRSALVVAAAAHLLLLAISIPSLPSRDLPTVSRRPVAVVRSVRFQPPKPPARQQRVPSRKAKRVPIPDPTPEAPEPIVAEEFSLPEIELDLPPLSGDVFGIPDAPPTTGPVSPQPVHLDGEISAPVKVYFPRPRYTEEARQARLQGVVVLQVVVRSDGSVGEIEVLKHLGLGLTESAVETVRTWGFEPATLDGDPIPVFLNLVVNFHLQ